MDREDDGSPYGRLSSTLLDQIVLEDRHLELK
jgi:hypothetical protein